MGTTLLHYILFYVYSQSCSSHTVQCIYNNNITEQIKHTHKKLEMMYDIRKQNNENRLLNENESFLNPTRPDQRWNWVIRSWPSDPLTHEVCDPDPVDPVTQFLLEDNWNKLTQVTQLFAKVFLSLYILLV